MKICSACLLGVKCRYNGKSKPNQKVIDLLKEEVLIPVCPEQLGGLPTPRESAERQGNKVITKSGTDVTASFELGASETMRIVEMYGIKEAIFKQEGPSCGSGKIHDGTFSDKLTEGDGLTTELLKKNGVRIMTEEEL